MGGKCLGTINCATLGRARESMAWVLPPPFFFYASGPITGCRLALMLHGSSSSMRLMGCSAMRRNTWREIGFRVEAVQLGRAKQANRWRLRVRPRNRIPANR